MGTVINLGYCLSPSKHPPCHAQPPKVELNPPKVEREAWSLLHAVKLLEQTSISHVLNSHALTLPQFPSTVKTIERGFTRALVERGSSLLCLVPLVDTPLTSDPPLRCNQTQRVRATGQRPKNYPTRGRDNPCAVLPLKWLATINLRRCGDTSVPPRCNDTANPVALSETEDTVDPASCGVCRFMHKGGRQGSD